MYTQDLTQLTLIYIIVIPTMAQLFTRYEDEFVRYLLSTSRKIESISTQPVNKKELAFNQIKLELTDAEKSLKYMEVEVGSLPPQIKANYQIKQRKYKKEYEEVRRKLMRIEEKYVDDKNKQQLMGAMLDEEGQNGRENLIQRGQMMSDATYKLKDSVRTMRETEQIQNSVQIELVSQTQRMSRMIQKPKEINEDLTQSQYFLRKISLNIKKNKIILGAVAGIILLVIIIVVWIVIAKRTK